MSFAYWDKHKLKIGYKVGTKWKYKRVPSQIQAIEKADPQRAFELAEKLAEEIDRQSAAAIETWGSDDVTLRMFLKKFIADRRTRDWYLSTTTRAGSGITCSRSQSLTC